MSAAAATLSLAHQRVEVSVTTKVAWSQPRPAPIVLVSGSESVTAERAIRAIRRQLRAEHPELEYSTIDADQYSPGALLAFAGPSLFGEPRLIEVSSVEHCTDEFLEDALRYVGQPEAEVTVILRHAGGNRGKKLLDAVRMSDASIEVECAAITRDADKQAFVLAEFSAAGRRIDAQALRRLVDAFAGDLPELASACQQLISDVSGDVALSDVDTYFGSRVEATAFTVADAAIAGRTGEALVLLRHALATGADPVPVVAAFAMKARLMAKVAGVRGSGASLAKAVGAAPWQIDRARKDSQGWTPAQLVTAISVIAETDAAVKGVERDPVFAVERMVRCVSQRVALPRATVY